MSFIFLPLSKPIRIKIGKQGDKVRPKFLRDEVPSEVPEELIVSLKDDPGELQLFQKLSNAD